MSGNGYRYTGEGERYRGVPARDITQAEYEALGPLEQRTVLTSGAYKEAPAQKKEADKPVESVEKEAD